jgi:mercuric ion transport protein
MISKIAYRSTLITGVLAALGATACCVLPLVLVTLGLSGAWMASLRSLEAYQPLFAAVTLGCLGYAYYSLYVQPRRCAPGEACASPAVLRRQRIAFWLVVAAIVVLGIAYAYIATLE